MWKRQAQDLTAISRPCGVQAGSSRILPCRPWSRSCTAERRDLQAAGNDLGAEITHHALHEGIVAQRRLGAALPLESRLRIAPRGGVAHRPELDCELLRMAGGLEREPQAFPGNRLVERFTLDPQRPVLAIAQHELRLQGKLPD